MINAMIIRILRGNPLLFKMLEYKSTKGRVGGKGGVKDIKHYPFP